METIRIIAKNNTNVKNFIGELIDRQYQLIIKPGHDILIEIPVPKDGHPEVIEKLIESWSDKFFLRNGDIRNLTQLKIEFKRMVN